MPISILFSLLFSLLSLLLSPLVQAEIYKCTENGRTVFADTPCGDNAEVVDVSASQQKTGARFANDAIDALGSQMGRERRQAELKRAIDRAQKDINTILDNYNLEKARLERELAEHRNRKYHHNWKHHHYKREQYYEKQRDLNNQLKAVHREFKADREKAYNKLSSLKRESAEIR